MLTLVVRLFRIIKLDALHPYPTVEVADELFPLFGCKEQAF